MPDKTLDVKRIGNVCTIYTDDAGGKPLPISCFEDEPGMANTMSYRDVMAQFGNYNIRWVEKDKPPEAPVKPRDPKMDEQIAAIKARYGETMPTNSKEPRVLDGGPVASNHTSSTIPVGVTNFLKTLKVAARYASEENESILNIKIECIQELIKEVWDAS